jgi:tetratricopeptide (TPR) repeat protein
LGAWIASILSSIFLYPAVVFDNPGAKEIIQKYHAGNTEGMQESSLTNYQAKPNLFNTIHPQIGVTFQLTTFSQERTHKITNIRSEINYSLAQHSIENIVEAFNPNTGMPYLERIAKVESWPYGGREAINNLVNVLPERAQRFIYFLFKMWTTKHIPYKEYFILIIKLLINTPKPKAGIVSTLYIAIKKIRESLSYDYAQFSAGETKNKEEEFERRFKGHYKTIKFDEYALTPRRLPESILRILNEITDLARNKRIDFSPEYAYLDAVSLLKDPINSSISAVKISSSTQMTAIDFRRELMKNMRGVYKYLNHHEVQHISQKLNYGIPTLIHNFVYRKDLLEGLKKRLEKNSSSIPKIKVIYGPSGIGKTQFAIHFASAAYNEGAYEAIVWITAGDSCINSYQEFAKEVLGDSSNLLKQDEKIKKVNNFFSGKYNSILFIFDNVTSYEELKPYLMHLPIVVDMHVLILTQNQQLANYYDGLLLDKFTSDESISYVKNTLSKREVSNKDALKLAEMSYFHPLFLSYFTAYLLTKNITFDEFFQQYEREKHTILQKLSPKTPNTEQWSAILFSLERVSIESPLARKILNVCAFLNANDIKQNLIELYFNEIDPEDISSACQTLCRYSFINIDFQKPGYLYTHDFLQEVLRYQLEKNFKCKELLLTNLLRFFSENLKKEQTMIENLGIISSDNMKLLSVHAETLCKKINPNALPDEPLKNYADIFLFIGGQHFAFLTGSLIAARDKEPLTTHRIENHHIQDQISAIENNKAALFFNNALRIYRDIYKSDNHPSIAGCLNNLGIVYDSLGVYSEARKYFEQALVIYRFIAEGPDYTHIIMCLNNLGSVLSRMKEYLKAKEYVEEALEICREIYKNENNKYIVFCLNNLGIIHSHLGSYTEAKQYSQQALEISKTLYSEISQNIAMCLTNLGNLSYHLSEYLQAKEYFEASLGIYQKIYAINSHPSVARCFIGLSEVFLKQGNYIESEEYIKKAISIYNKVYGDANHPDMAICLNTLGELSCHQKKYCQAKEYLEAALNLSPDMALSYFNLGYISLEERNYAKAREYVIKAYSLFKETYKSGIHPNIAMCFLNLGVIYAYIEEYIEARRYFETALAMYRNIYGQDKHSNILVCLSNLGKVYFSLGESNRAKEYIEQAENIKQQLSVKFVTEN